MKILLIIILLMAFQSCDNRSKNRKAADEIASKMNGTEGLNIGHDNYSIDVPKGWTTDYVTEYGIDYYFLRAPKTKDNPNTNINVVTESMYNLSLDEYRNKAIESVIKAIPSALILGQGEIQANGVNGLWYSYSMKPQGIEATLVCYIFPQENVAYSITAGTQTNDAATYRNIFDSVAKSFKFLK